MSNDPDKFAALKAAAKGRQKLPRRPRSEVSPRVRLLTIDDLIDAGYGSRRTIWRRVKAKDLPAPVVIGVKAYWRQTAIEAWLDKHVGKVG